MENHADQVEAYASEIAKAAKTLAAEWRQADGSFPVGDSAASDSDSAQEARKSLIAHTTKIYAQASQPVDFLRSLALHTQFLACLQWVCEFQVLACIPLDMAVSISDVAGISGVPEVQLCRVVSMLATAGFFHEPRPGCVAHSPLSAPFVTQPALQDAVMFLSETAAPAALKMAVATRQFTGSDRPERSAYTAAFDDSTPISSVLELQPKLQRQFKTYLTYVTVDDEVGIHDVLMHFDWQALGTATVVDIGASSAMMADALETRCPGLQLIVQMYETGPGALNAPASRQASLTSGGGGARVFSPLAPFLQPAEQGLGGVAVGSGLGGQVTLQQRIPGTAQLVRNAAVYILRLPPPCLSLSWTVFTSHAISEIRAHLAVLRAQPSSRLLLTALILPGSEATNAEAESATRLRDLSLMQLANGRQPDKGDMLDLLRGIQDGSGKLVVTSEIRSPNSPFVAFEIRYQPHRGSNSHSAAPHHVMLPT